MSTAPPTTGLIIHRLLHTQTWVLWAWGIFAGVVVLVTAATARFSEVDRSVLESANSGPRWFLFAAGIVMTTVALPVMIAHGITRRTFFATGVAVTAIVAIGSAAAMAAGFLLERTVFTATDLPHTLTQPHLFDSVSQVHMVLVEFGLLFTAYLISGWLVGTCFYRLGWLRGILTLPLALLPIAGVEASLATDWVGRSLFAIDAAPFADAGMLVQTGTSLAVIVAGLAAARLLTRHVPIKPKRN